MHGNVVDHPLADVLDAGFRQAHLIGLYERPLLPPEEGESDLRRAARTFAELITAEHLHPEMCATSMRGEATLRLLSMPFSDPKKIEQVIGTTINQAAFAQVTGANQQ